MTTRFLRWIFAPSCIGLFLAAVFGLAYLLHPETKTVAKGTVESAEYLRGSYGASASTVIRLDSGDVVPVPGLHQIKIGRPITITKTGRHYRIHY